MPRSILILGLLLIGKGLLLLAAFGLLVVVAIAHRTDLLPPLAATLPLPSNRELVESTTFLTIGLFALLGGIGVLRLRGWGWLMATVGQGMSLTLALVAYSQGRPSYAQMLADVLLVLYLNQREVSVVFVSARRRDGVLQVGAEESLAPLDIEHEALIQ